MHLRIFCLFNMHKPKRRAVKWDGLNFVGGCVSCHKRIRRWEDKGWKLDTTEAPEQPPRVSGGAR
jgi:hypothetical protein